MPERDVRTPGPDHPITVSRTGSRVRITVGDQLVADTQDALTLQEASYAPVQYVPLADVDSTLLTPSEHATYCPYKGDASYFDLTLADGSSAAAKVWYYRAPYPAVAEIVDHVAFYPDTVEVEVA